MCNEAAAAAATVLEKRQRRPCLLSSLRRRSETPPAAQVGAAPRPASGGPGAWGGWGGAVGGSDRLRAPWRRRRLSQPALALTSDFPEKNVETARGCVRVRAGRQTGARGGRGGRGRPGASRAACCRAGSAARGPTWRPGNSRGGARPLTLKGRGEAGAGARPRPSACPPARRTQSRVRRERAARAVRHGRPAPGAPRAPRTQHQPRAPTYLGEGSCRSARRVRGKLRRRFPRLQLGARLPVPGLGHPTPPPSTAPAPGPAGRTGLLPAAPGKGGRGGGASLHGLSPDAAAPSPGPAARTGPQGGSESAKCLVGARGGRRGRGGGCRGSARLGRRGTARAMLRMFGMKTGMK
nr:uncharacterized protein LOC115839580 [Globicephala melas]